METHIVHQVLWQCVGKENTKVVEIKKDLIRNIAASIGDENLLLLNEKCSLHSRYGSIVVPPYLFCLAILSGGDNRPEQPLPYERILDWQGKSIIKTIGTDLWTLGKDQLDINQHKE